MDDKTYLRRAVDQAKKSVDLGGFPAGAIIVKDDKIIAEGVSLGFQTNDPTGHAETSAIRAACLNLKTHDLQGAVMYESLECCTMCFSVAYWAGITKIVYATKKTPDMVTKLYYEGTTDNTLLNASNNRKIELVYIPDFEEESLALVHEWEQKSSG